MDSIPPYWLRARITHAGPIGGILSFLPMNPGKIVFRGSNENGRRLYAALLEKFPDCIEIESIDEVRGGLTKRPSLRQDPIMEFCIGVAGHVIALGAFEAIKEIVTAAADRNKLIILKIEPPSGEEQRSDR